MTDMPETNYSLPMTCGTTGTAFKARLTKGFEVKTTLIEEIEDE